MRLNINLASQKYEDARLFYLRWGAALILVLLITASLGFLAWKNHVNTIKDRQRIDSFRRQMEDLEKDQKQNEAVRNRPENRDAIEQSDFWNNIIDQRQFSWTQLFSDLERIMPGRAYVISIQPSLGPDNRLLGPDGRLKLELTIGGEKHENAVELIRKMEGSERFRFPEIKDEETKTTASKATVVEFKIVTYYTPALGPQPRPEEKEGT